MMNQSNSELTIDIRPATIIDAKVLAMLGASTFYDTFSSFHTEADMQLYLKKAYDIQTIQTNLIDPAIAYFIAYIDEQAVVYTKLLLEGTHLALSGKSIELEKIYVMKSFLGKGVGYALMQHAIQFARSNHYNNLFLGVWQENERAVKFYQKTGFQVVATRTFQLGQTVCDDFIMNLPI